MFNPEFPYSIDYAEDRNNEEIVRRAEMKPEKGEHFIGEKLYLYTPSNAYWAAMVRNPYTVIGVDGNNMTVQEAGLIFNGPRYYDTLPDDIVEDPNGRIVKLRWSDKKERWQESPAGSYPKVAVFGKWDYQPYLD